VEVFRKMKTGSWYWALSRFSGILFADALSGTRHDRVNRQLGNTHHALRTSERKRSLKDWVRHSRRTCQGGDRRFESDPGRQN